MLITMTSTLNTGARNLRERGAVAGEYAVLLALIGIALVTALGLFTSAITRSFQTVINFLPA